MAPFSGIAFCTKVPQVRLTWPGLQARALRSACSTPMAVDLEAMAPWHRLMMRVWNLSSMLRVAGVALPEGG